MASTNIKSAFILSVDQVSTRLTTRFSAGKDLDSFSRGLLDSFNPKNEMEYNLYRRYMHDILCLALVDYGYYDSEEFTSSKFSLQLHEPSMNTFKPDLYKVEQEQIRVCEVTFTFDVQKATQEKRSKYADYLALMEAKLEKPISFKVLAIDLTDAEWEDTIPKIDDLYMKMIKRFVSNLRVIHTTPTGISCKGTQSLYSLDRFNFKACSTSMSKIIEDITGMPGKFDEFKDYMKSGCVNDDGMTNDNYLSTLASSILKTKRIQRPRPSPDSVMPNDLINEWKQFCDVKPTTEKIPVVLQLGCPNLTEERSMSNHQLIDQIMSLDSSGGYLDHIRLALEQRGTNYNGDTHVLTMHLNDQMKKIEMLQGPGRKSYIKSQGLKIPRKQPTHIGIDNQHQVMLNDMLSIIDQPDPTDFIRDLEFPDASTMGDSMFNNLVRVNTMLYKSGTTYALRFYQSISQEIILNSMRRRRRNEYSLGYSGFNGIYFIIAPGSQLRTEANTIFVKIISVCSPIVHQLSRPWDKIGDHWESEWISVDTDRLKHWARSFDRVSVSFLASTERLVEPGMNLAEAMRLELAEKNYSLMALTYLENKQLTSSANQSIRYLWMKGLGDKQFKSLLSKFPSRVSSVIQSTMMQRAIQTTIKLSVTNLSEMLKSTQIIRDEDLGTLDETTTGTLGKLPRLFTNGPYVPISYNLNEIYWCMMYNKDRQNTTQDAMKILSKILREEVKFDDELKARATPEERYNHFIGKTTLTQDIEHINSLKPESHYFSMRAVTIGVDYQDKHIDNTCPSSTWLTDGKLNEILNKNLAEYATFKASVSQISHFIDNKEINEIQKIGNRTKCIELVYQMVNDESLKTASEVAMQFSDINGENYNTIIQIFKKNQVGGVREILILYIKARVMINIIEEISRFLSKADRREILTKGKDKRLMMRNDYEDLSSSFSKGTPIQIIRNSYDMTTWAQKFIPIVFLPIFVKHLRQDSMIDYSSFVLLKHCDKSIEFPKKLVEQWIKHPEMVHEEPHIQSYKSNFMKTGSVSFKNRSNMGQGILHYCSTVLALSCCSLRDALFARCLRILNVEKKIHWRTRVGSDDKGELIAIDMSDKSAYAQYLLLEHCSHASERLHSIELSVKSASGNILYELNSAFMSNLETLSPTIKFALASTDMISTNSCTRFVNESYARIRQLRENGSSSIVCGFAHILNSDHFYKVFRTGFGMTNDPRSVFKVVDELIPYDFGIYPFYDIDVQDLIGPEYHNYKIFTDKRTDVKILKFLYTELSNDRTGEILPNDETPLFKKDHFGINQGIVRQLINMRKRLSLSPEKIIDYLRENPFMIIRGPETLEETKHIIASKLYTKGAAESLRRTSPAIYIGRMAAFESASAWSSFINESKEQSSDEERCEDMNTSEDVAIINDEVVCVKLNLTYKEFLEQGFEFSETKEFDKEEYLDIIFPQHQSYEVVRQFVSKFGARAENKRKYSQAIRTWTLNNYNYNFTNSLRTILETSFGFSSSSSMDDVYELRKLVNMDLSSYDNLIIDCQAKGLRPLDLFFYMNKLFKNVSVSKPQVFASGPSTTSLNLTLMNVKKYNHLPNSVMYIDEGIDEEMSQHENRIDHVMDNLKLAFNLKMMEIQGYTQSSSEILSISTMDPNNTNLLEYCKTHVRNIKTISRYDNQTKKIIIFLTSVLLDKSEFKERLIRWKTLNYSYIKAQTKVFDTVGRTTWEGDLILLVNSGDDCFTLNIINGVHFIETLRLKDVEVLYKNLTDLCKMLDLDYRSFIHRTSSKIDDIYLKNRRFYRAQIRGNMIDKLKVNEVRTFRYNRLQDFDTFSIDYKKAKDQSISISLRDGHKRSATICHFPGHYYPTPIPKGFKLPDDVWLFGIRLNRVFENDEWFFNGQFRSMTSREASDFLRNDIKFDELMSQGDSIKTRMADYISLHEEVNEEAFGLNIENEYINKIMKPQMVRHNDEMLDMDFDTMFRETMNEQMENQTWQAEEIDWAEEMNDLANGDITMEDLMGKTMADEGVGFARALGMRKPTAKKNFFSISNLKQGSLLKTRVLDLFFSSGSILSENRYNLPFYCIWLNNNDQLDRSLCNELVKHIKEYMVYSTGAPEWKLTHIINKANVMMAKPIDRVQTYMYGTDQDIWELIRSNEDKYDVEDSDVD